MTEMSEITVLDLQADDATEVVQALAEREGVLAMITKIEGRFYRPTGTMMGFFPDGSCVGQLSGGCIEGDLGLRAREAMAKAQASTYRYGRNSPFIDLRLPCGSGIDVTLLPSPDRTALGGVLTSLCQRRIGVLSLPGLPDVQIKPRTRVVVYGTGLEVSAFSRMAEAFGIETEIADQRNRPDIDAYTAVVLLFHDHESETRILADMLDSPAFWIGAQGSRLAQSHRLEALRSMNIPEAQLARIRGPIGLIKQARDPKTMALSVLAEIVAHRP